MDNRFNTMIQVHLRCINKLLRQQELDSEISSLQERKAGGSDSDRAIYNEEINRRQEEYHTAGLEHRGDLESLIDMTNG